MMRYNVKLAVGLLAMALAAACDTGERVLQIDASGRVSGIAFTDRDGDGRLSTGDRPAAGVRLSLVHPGSSTRTTVTTGADGRAVFQRVPVGSYRLTVDPAELGDSLEAVHSDSLFRVPPEDSVQVTVRLQYPSFTVGAARQQPSGKFLVTKGVALHGPSVFGDSTVHVVGDAGAIRVTGVLSTTQLSAGDSVRVIGRRITLAGQPAVESQTLTRTGRGEAPSPVRLTSAEAATARDGTLDAALVEIVEATVVTVTQPTGGDTQVTINDGSGPARVVLDRDARITYDQPLVPGAMVSVVGVIVPSVSGDTWTVKPRETRDLRVVVPTLPITEARGLEIGRLVAVEGVTLTGWATFGDGTIHVADRTGAIRVIATNSSFLFTGDSIRVVGIVTVRDGQPVITSSSATVLGKSAAPAPRPVSTADAASALGGVLDAALVEVGAEAVGDTSTVSNELHLTLDDGTGPLTVVLDRDSGISAASLFPARPVRITGVLVPQGPGRPWILKPRSQADLR